MSKCRTGVYLVGDFFCSSWDAKDKRQRVAKQNQSNTVIKKLDAQAKELSKGNLVVRSCVIDTSLDGGEEQA